ncbi:hypothetical protein [Sinorhizobium medicae]|nr:hypothetical protein [Sinorhizobium medicae]WQP36617.1 hypothetical protein U8C38_11240 [Sinorhizobium medicae]
MSALGGWPAAFTSAISRAKISPAYRRGEGRPENHFWSASRRAVHDKSPPYFL